MRLLGFTHRARHGGVLPKNKLYKCARKNAAIL